MGQALAWRRPQIPTLLFLVALVAVTLPLLWPQIPPLNDLPGHIGRYHIAANIGQSPDLARHWRYDWALIGNLGVDLPAIALTPSLGAVLAAKIVVLTIPGLFVLGLWLIGRTRGHPLPPLAGFAFALAYGQAFQFGFVNFSLSAALALIALAGWIVLDRRPVLRALTFLPASWLLWIAHSSGWGMFGLLAWGSAVMLAREAGAGWRAAALKASVQCLPLATPLLAIIAATGIPAEPPVWRLSAKASALVGLLRDRWQLVDISSAGLIVALLWTALRKPGWRFDPVLAGSGAMLLLGFVALPHAAMNGAYLDMRLLAPALAILLFAVRIEDPRQARHIAFAAGTFLAARMVATTISFLLYDGAMTRTAAAIDGMPHGSSVMTLVAEPCSFDWRSDRLAHIGGLAIVRRNVFENGQWAIPGQQSLKILEPADPLYRTDPSQIVYPRHCEPDTVDRDTALARFDRRNYTHVWLIGLPGHVPTDLIPIFRNERSTLYRVATTAR